MEAVKYVETNEYGSVVIVGTGTHVEAVGFAHEGGHSEQELLEWFHLSKEQLYGALAYFYGNREALIAKEKEAAKLAEAMAQEGTQKLREWREKKSS